MDESAGMCGSHNQLDKWVYQNLSVIAGAPSNFAGLAAAGLRRRSGVG